MSTPLAAALHEAMRARGLRVADLAREMGQSEATVRAAADGRVAVPHKPVRDAFDVYFGAALGTTLDICEGRAARYPGVPIRELVALVAPLPPDGLAGLVTFVRTVTGG